MGLGGSSLSLEVSLCPLALFIHVQVLYITERLQPKLSCEGCLLLLLLMSLFFFLFLVSYSQITVTNAPL